MSGVCGTTDVTTTAATTTDALTTAATTTAEATTTDTTTTEASATAATTTADATTTDATTTDTTTTEASSTAATTTTEATTTIATTTDTATTAVRDPECHTEPFSTKVGTGCKEFFYCEGGRIIEKKACPAGLFFNGRFCDSAANVNCEPDPDCLKKPNSFSAKVSTGCRDYVFCENGLLIATVTCPDGLLFNGVHCDWAEKVNCAIGALERHRALEGDSTLEKDDLTATTDEYIFIPSSSINDALSLAFNLRGITAMVPESSSSTRLSRIGQILLCLPTMWYILT
jgi:hypothetical protein